MRSAGFILFTLFSIVVDISAQTSSHPPQPDLPSLPAPQSFQHRVHPSRVLDKKYFAVMGALGAAESMRVTTRTLVLDHEMAEGAPWVS